MHYKKTKRKFYSTEFLTVGSSFLIFLGCHSKSVDQDSKDFNRRFENSLIVEVVESSERNFFTIDGSVEFSLYYGFGGGPDGLEAFKLDHHGSISIQKSRGGEIVETNATLSRKELGEIVSAINRCRVLELERSYFVHNIVDGEIRILFAKQGKKEKLVSANSYTPLPLRVFEDQIDSIISGRNLDWRTIPDQEQNYESFLKKRVQQ